MKETVAVAVQRVPQPPHVQLVARDPVALEQAQQQLVAWVQGKIKSVQLEATDLHENLEYARKNKWRVTGFESALRRAGQRLGYYQKLLVALQAGFYIIPELNADIFAIRTKQNRPTYQSNESKHEWGRDEVLDETSKALPAGAGRYVNPTPEVEHLELPGEKPGEIQHNFYTTDYQDVEFPFVLVKPEIIAAADRAMALKVFDDFGVVPGRSPKGDPMIIARIRRPWEGRYSNNRFTSFLVAWFLNMEDL